MMNPVRKFFDSQRKHFEPGAKFEKFYFVFENIESVFYSSEHVTTTGPHVRDSMDVKRFFFLVIVALLPHYAFGTYNVGYQSYLAAGLQARFFPVILKGLVVVLPMVIVTYAVGYFWEALFATVRKHEISEGLFVSCALFPLTLPPTQPLWQVALGISFGIVIGKEIFGGTGKNFLNPALTGRAFLYFAYPAQTSGDAVWTVLKGAQTAPVDAFTGATPLAVAAATESGSVHDALLNAGYTVSKLLWGLYPDSIGASSSVLAIVGAIFLVCLKIADYRLIAGSIIGILATASLLNLLAGDASAPYLKLHPVYHLLMGGSAFAMVYMCTCPITAPDMAEARWVYAISIGSLTVLIRVFNPAFPEGVGLAVLFMNCFAPLLDEIVVRTKLKKRIPNVQ